MGNACLPIAETGDITAEWWIKSYDAPMALLFRVGCN